MSDAAAPGHLRPLLAIPIVAAALCLAGERGAGAGGIYLPDPGVVAQGRGCAYTATADELIGAFYNPAGLHDIDGFYVHVAGGLIARRVWFDREGGENVYKPFRDDEDPSNPADIEAMLSRPFDPLDVTTWQLIPELGLAYGLRKPDLTFGFIWYTPYSSKNKYPADGIQRYTIIESSGWQIHWSLFASYKPLPFLSFGISGGPMLLRAWQWMKATANALASDSIGLVPNDENPLYDIDIEMEGTDWKPWIIAGVMVTPAPWLRVGAAFSPGFTMRADTELSMAATMEVVEGYPLVIDTGDEVSMTVGLPPILRLGVAVAPHERFEVELDLEIEGWSTVGELSLTGVDVDLSDVREQIEAMATGYSDDVSAIIDEMDDAWRGSDGSGTVDISREYRDAWSLRLGVEGAVAPWLDLRCGGLFERSGMVDEYISVSEPNTDKVGLSVGASLGPPGFHVHVSWLHYVYAPLVITDGVEEQFTALPGIEPNNVNNGSYRSHADIIGLAISFRDAERREHRPRAAR